MAQYGFGQGWKVQLLVLLLTAACLLPQAVLAEGFGWHSSSSDQQGQHAQQPVRDLGAVAPRPGGSGEQHIFGSDAGSLQAGAAYAAQHAASDSSFDSGSPASSLLASSRPRVPLLAVTVMSAVMALMSCLGVLPYFFCSKLSKPWAGVANAVASGVMLAASFGLLAEGAPYGGTYLVLGMLLGVVFVKFSQEHLEQYEVDSFEQLAGADARKVILFLAVMAVHAVGEGGGVGVSFAGDRGWAQGTLVTLAIGLHNVPEGLAVATVMAAKGTSPRRTLLWTALTALPQALVAPPAFVFVDTFRALLPLAMGFAAGCMIWVVLAELLPDALEAVDPEKVATCATASAAWLQGLSIWIAHLETPAGTLASPFGNYTAVLPLGITPLLPQLAPVILLPTLAAAAASRTALPPVLLTAASAGLLAAYAACCWLQLLLSSPHWVLSGVLAPAVGAVVAAALWRQLQSWQQQGWSSGTFRVSKSSGSPMFVQAYRTGSDCKAAAAAGMLVTAVPAGDLSAGESGSDGCGYSSGSSSVDECSGQPFYKPLHSHLPRLGGVSPAQQQQQPFQQQRQHQQGYLTQHLQQQRQQQQQQGYAGGHVVVTAPAAPYVGSPHQRHQRSSDESAAAAAAAEWGVPGQQQQQGQAGGPGWEHQGAAAGGCSSNSSSSNSPVCGSSAAAAAAAPSMQQLLRGRGDVHLNIGAAATAAAAAADGIGAAATAAAAAGFGFLPSSWQRQFEPRKRRHSWGFSAGLGRYASQVQGSSQAVAAASMLAAGGVAAACVPLGLQLAAALTADPSNSGHVVVPMVLVGCVMSLGALGFLLLLLSSHKQRTVTAAAALVSSVPVFVAVAALLSQPAWVSQGSARVAADSLQGLAAGYNLLVLLVLLLPAVKRWGPKAVAAGAWGGAATGLVVCAGVAGLCLGTPYCLHVHSTVAASL